MFVCLLELLLESGGRAGQLLGSQHACLPLLHVAVGDGLAVEDSCLM